MQKSTKKTSSASVYYTLAGRDGIENKELNEFTSTVKELEPYKYLIPQMRKVEKSVISTNKVKKFFNRSFTLHGINGKVVVINNANVGSWGANSRYFFNKNDNIKIDAQGNLIGYKPFKIPYKSLHFLVVRYYA